MRSSYLHSITSWVVASTLRHESFHQKKDQSFHDDFLSHPPFSLCIGHAMAQGMGSIASASSAPVALGSITPAPSNVATSSTGQPMGVNPSTGAPKGAVGSAQPVTVAPSSRPTMLTSGTLSPEHCVVSTCRGYARSDHFNTHGNHIRFSYY
jgi:hypothetical protein